MNPTIPDVKLQVTGATPYRLALLITLLAFTVVLLGAYVRLSDAGLGCPDWPGCYGRIDVPSTQYQIDTANTAFPHSRVDRSKAWKEMIHRYMAGLLGIAILALALIMTIQHRRHGKQPLRLPWLLVLLVCFQALLGMWTVTLQVKPVVVTAHLLGGMATVSLLWLLTLRLKPTIRYRGVTEAPPYLRRLSLAGVIVVAIQITLGGWTSSNYAAIGCVEFPACIGGNWWPAMDFQEAFVLWRGIGINYEFGLLESSARTAIHMSHRIGALATALYLGALGLLLLLNKGHSSGSRRLGQTLLLLLFLQLGLGIGNVIAQRPLPVAIAHNGVAALLLLTLISLAVHTPRD